MTVVQEDDLFRIGGILHEARMRECFGNTKFSFRREWPATLKDFTRQRHAGQPWIDVAVAQVNAMYGLLQDSFDLGFKAAGGTTIPDGARDVVELAVDRETLERLAVLAEGSIPKSPGLRQFLENISIYRRSR